MDDTGLMWFQPSKPWVAPPPPLAKWRMKAAGRPVRRFKAVPAPALVRAQPACTRSGTAWDNAIHTASTMVAQVATVHWVVGAPSRGFTSDPSGAETSTGRMQPSFTLTSAAMVEKSPM